MKLSRTILLTTLLSVISLSIKAQLSEKPNAHVIVAVDNALPPAYWNYLRLNQETIVSQLDKLVGKYCRLDTSDYVSMVTFAIGVNDASFQEFAKPAMMLNNKPLKWVRYSGFSKLFNSQSIRWEDAISEGTSRVTGDPYSMLTGAKQYTVNSVRLPRQGTIGTAANRTLLAVITDDNYNGNDAYDKEFSIYKGMGGKASHKEFAGMIKDFHDNFNFIKFDQETILYPLTDKPYRIQLYEMRPALRPSVSSVVDYPASLNLHRVRGGYSIDFTASSVDSLYRLKKFRVEVMKTDGTSISNDFYPNASGVNHVTMHINYGDIEPEHVIVTVKAWLQQIDGIYNGCLLSPFDPSSKRLSATLNLSCTDEGLVLGIPLSDILWWWFPSDIKLAAFLWEMIIILLIVAAVVILLFYYNRKTSVYDVDNAEISIAPMMISGLRKRKKTQQKIGHK